jgi:hypothetical protein
MTQEIQPVISDKNHFKVKKLKSVTFLPFSLILSLLMLTVFSVLLSCGVSGSSASSRIMELGEINFNPEPDTCGSSKCFNFTSSSSLVEEIKTGVIRIDEPEGSVIGTVAMYSGGLGKHYYSERKEGKKLVDETLRKGFRVIQIKWNEGWFAGSLERQEGFRKLAVHPATVTQYIHDNLLEKDKPLILFGGSGGAAQIAYMLSFYGIDAIADKAIIFSGFWMGRLDLGCFDDDPLHSHLKYSERARVAIDQSLGFSTDVKGPCELRDSSYIETYKNSSISVGGNYYYPNTNVYLIYGGNDQVGALNQGLTYFEQLAFARTRYLNMQVIEGVGHGILQDSLGFEIIRKILFTEGD